MVQDLDVPMVLATADPPDHGRQRKVLSRLFTRSSIEQREAEVRALVDELLDPHLRTGAMEWMSQAAIPLPAVVLSRLLGLPDEAAELSGTSVMRRASRSVGSRPRSDAVRSKRSSAIWARSQMPTDKHVPQHIPIRTP